MTRLEQSASLQRTIRTDSPDELGVSTLNKALEAIEADRREEAEELVKYLWQEYMVVHDTFVDYWWRLYDYIAENFGEQALFEALKGGLVPPLQGLVMAYEMVGAEGYVQLMAEFHRAHIGGAGRLGDFKIEDQGDRYKITLDPCGGGGNMRRCGSSVGTILPGAEDKYEYGLVKGAHPWTWGKENISRYCVHSCAIETFAVEAAGYSPMTFESPQAPDQPCIMYVYKDPKAIPDVYYERLGKTKPELP